MSEYQLFCYAEKLGSDETDSYQQKPYRVFNTQVTEKEFNKINIPKIKLEFDSNLNYLTRYQTAFKNAWKTLSKDKKQEFLDIPHFDSDIFFKITGVNVTKKTINEMTVAEIEAKLGIKNLKIVK